MTARPAEVRLPSCASHTSAMVDNTMLMSDWEDAGVRSTDMNADGSFGSGSARKVAQAADTTDAVSSKRQHTYA